MDNIIFFNKTTNKSVFSDFSNFIAKYDKQEKMVKGDVENIAFIRVITNEEVLDNHSIVCKVEENMPESKEIRKPENIFTGISKRNVIFCLYIDMSKLVDVSELISVILIKKYYMKYHIVILLRGSDKNYFKASHFLCRQTEDKNIFNSIFYKNNTKNDIKRLQRKNIGSLTHFLPAIWIDGDLLKEIVKPISLIFPPKTIYNTLLGEEDYRHIKDSLLSGSLKILYDNRMCFLKEEVERFDEILSCVNILAWILFAYSLQEYKKMKDVITVDNVKLFIEQINLYAGACMQLIENVVFHSKRKQGIFSLRIFKADSNYIMKKYGNSIDLYDNYIEMIIADYAGDNDSGNIAENFISKITNDKLKEEFKNFKPVDFFMGGIENSTKRKELEKLWISFYESEKNIGKHFGIRIFDNMIANVNGKFVIESHTNHVSQEGENWRGIIGEKCLPGTAYTILLPIQEMQRKLMHIDISIDKDTNVERMLDYNPSKIQTVSLENINITYKTQSEKEENIFRLKKEIIDKINTLDYEMWYISAENYINYSGEIFCKALLLVQYDLRKMPHIIFYDCEKTFIESCVNTIFASYRNNSLVLHNSANEFQIALFAKETYEQVVLIPDDFCKTILLNEQLNFSRGVVSEWNAFYQKGEYAFDGKNDIIMPIPFDVLYPVYNGKTIFEKYTKKIVERDIQEKAFGCKISDTHMRLGSTIHVDTFYEAELLFGNKLFISRFAYLLFVNIKDQIKNEKKITLYGYATYSELLIFELMSMIIQEYSDKDIDYAILEREMENRGDSHIDKIRYSGYLGTDNERRNHFRDRKIICIVPIASTLKTNEKLVRLFCEENGEGCDKNIINHYIMILVGSSENNAYWSINDNKVISKKSFFSAKNPEFFVNVQVAYKEAIECDMCFPEKILNEKPIIEVNAASTIPNQAFGLYRGQKNSIDDIKWLSIKEQEEYLSCLKQCLIYAHVKRGENHFLFYFQTEKLMIQEKDKIKTWLENDVAPRITLKNNEYHVIFCPSSFSNVGFLEYINRFIFHDAAIIIRDDIDKEYRSNISAKYSNIKLLFENLESLVQEKKVIKFYYVDDSIITGRTFSRSKSLIESVVDAYTNKYSNIEVHIFEKIFVLVDRNSNHSRMPYVGCWDTKQKNLGLVDQDFFAFRKINISSLRNHADSCVICKLERNAGILNDTSSTGMMLKHWRKEQEKFQVKSLKQYLSENPNIDEGKKEQAFRRLVCTHIAQTLINENTHGNYKENAIVLILQLLLEDYNNRNEKEDIKLEYFLSYLKVISRPFMVFNKAIKQAIFDILLVFIECLLSKKGVKEVLEDIGADKEYLNEPETVVLFEQINNSVINAIEYSKQVDFLLLLMKQLAELKSNYIIRLENINKISNFVKDMEPSLQEKLYSKYLQYVKHLTGVSSDTSKSAWLDYALHNGREINSTNGINLELEELYIEQMYIENSRVYFDGIKKLDEMYTLGDEENDILKASEKDNEILKTVQKVSNKLYEALSDYQFGNFKRVLEDYSYVYINNNKKTLTERGTIFLLSSIALFQKLKDDGSGNKQLDENNEELLEKCNTIAKLVCNILNARNVEFVMEMDAAYDEWKGLIVKDFNDLNKQNNNLVEEKNIVFCKEYLILADSKSGGSGTQEFDFEVAKRIKNYNGDVRHKMYGYELNSEEHYLIWKMKSEEVHPIFMYADLSDTSEDTKWVILNNVRNSMVFYHMLNDKLFNYENGGQLYQIITNGHDLQISNRAKVYSHTKQNVRNKHYQHTQKPGNEQYYSSYILTLLADLNISEIYRKSLKKEFYSEYVDIRPVKLKADDSILNEDSKEYFLARESASTVEVCVQNRVIVSGDEKLSDNDAILCYNVTNGQYVVYLLIYSLIMNVGEEGRARLEQGKINVYLSKTKEGNLRVCNLMGGPVDIEEVNKEIKIPPQNENKGITLWSISRYIKSMMYCALHQNYIRLQESKCTYEQILEYGVIVEEYLNGKFELKADIMEENGQKYFSVEVPILIDRYKNLLN